ncbi:HNH endonuclease [Schleiferilactobacillus harbinensis]|uniref:HNH endonuclease n=1 Tax=Schleiferilactobacillus harbinensis TaxID=304207 RepID=UPI001AAECFCB|nr:HNH endonuclease [Schleiferilactobacillus harbinensis]MBO3091665.1 HNH endonuclease [Schleiferilactobacillus harbinensis]
MIKDNVLINDVEFKQCGNGKFSQYYAAADGRISTSTGRLLNPTVNNAGYAIVNVSTPLHASTTTSVQHLVALAWIPNPEGLSDVDHLNNDPLDNRACNLQWLSHADNLRKAHRLTKVRDGRINGRVVFQFCYDGGKAKLVQKFSSINSAATSAGVSFTTMRGWAKNPTKEHNGNHYSLTLN